MIQVGRLVESRRPSMSPVLSRKREIHAIPEQKSLWLFCSGCFLLVERLSRKVIRLRIQVVRAFLPDDRNLVDPASSHMLVSKIKPCMSQYKS